MLPLLPTVLTLHGSVQSFSVVQRLKKALLQCTYNIVAGVVVVEVVSVCVWVCARARVCVSSSTILYLVLSQVFLGLFISPFRA